MIMNKPAIDVRGSATAMRATTSMSARFPMTVKEVKIQAAYLETKDMNSMFPQQVDRLCKLFSKVFL